MLTGQYLHTLDDKKRLVLPAKFRDDFGTNTDDKIVYVTIEIANRGTWLSLHTAESMKRLRERAERAADENEDGEWYLRKLGADTEEFRLDPQWRLTLTDRFVEAAKLKRDVTVLGVFSRIEVWDVETWKQVDQSLAHQAPQLRKALYRAGPEP